MADERPCALPLRPAALLPRRLTARPQRDHLSGPILLGSLLLSPTLLGLPLPRQASLRRRQPLLQRLPTRGSERRGEAPLSSKLTRALATSAAGQARFPHKPPLPGGKITVGCPVRNPRDPRGFLPHRATNHLPNQQEIRGVRRALPTIGLPPGEGAVLLRRRGDSKVGVAHEHPGERRPGDRTRGSDCSVPVDCLHADPHRIGAPAALTARILQPDFRRRRGIAAERGQDRLQGGRLHQVLVDPGRSAPRPIDVEAVPGQRHDPERRARPSLPASAP
jgi:hypothetical protein